MEMSAIFSSSPPLCVCASAESDPLGISFPDCSPVVICSVSSAVSPAPAPAASPYYAPHVMPHVDYVQSFGYDTGHTPDYSIVASRGRVDAPAPAAYPRPTPAPMPAPTTTLVRMQLFFYHPPGARYCQPHCILFVVGSLLFLRLPLCRPQTP